MNKVIKQENELNLVEGARNIVRKFGPRKLAVALALSSMLTMTACGKKEEKVQNTTINEEANNEGKYRNRPLGGRIVDNHNKELYISKASDLESVVQGTSEVPNKTTSSNTQNNSKNTTNNSNNGTNNNANIPTTPPAQTPSENVVGDNSQENIPTPDLFQGESATFYPDGSYVVEPSKDYINPPKDETPTQPDEPSKEEPSLPPVEEEPEIPPVEEEKSQGYVVRKLNSSDDTYYYLFTNVGGLIDVQLIDKDYSDGIEILSDINAWAEDDNAVSYALSEGWVKVKPYSYEEDGFLDSVYNLEAECDNVVANALKAKEEADMGLYLVP